MYPQKVALISNSDLLIQTISDSLGQHDQLIFYHSWQDVENCSVLLFHHDPPLRDCLANISLLRKAYPQTPIIVIGSTSTPFDIAEAFRLGANDFLFQPLEDEMLINCLHRYRINQQPDIHHKWWKIWLSWTWLWKEPVLAISAINTKVSKSSLPSLRQKPDIQVQLFGHFSLVFQGKRIGKLPGKKAKSLLAYLLYKHPKPVHRDVLMDKFWGDSTHDSARNCLNVTLHSIRKSIETTAHEADIIIHENECYKIDERWKVERDIDLFESYWKKGQQQEQLHGIQAATNTYHQAFAFYRGDLLEDLIYEDWTSPIREKYRETWLVILDRLSVHFYEKGKYQVSKNLCQKMVEKDPCLEDVHRRIMDCYAQLKMPDMAIRQFHKCRDILKKELNITPARATWDLFLNIRDA